MASNGDTKRIFVVNGSQVRGIGSFHKTLHHNKYGEVRPQDFDLLVAATEGDGSGFAQVPRGTSNAAAFTNPQAGLANDCLTRHPAAYSMPPAPTVLSLSIAAEMTELYWMALLRDVSFDAFAGDPRVSQAAQEIDQHFQQGVGDTGDAGHLVPGVDVPGRAGTMAGITPQNLFRLGLPGEEVGPMVSQFFVREAHYGTQRIDQMQRPYKKDRDYLTDFPSWMHAQNSGRDMNGQAYPKANEDSAANFEQLPRYISTPRDLARFVNKDALHQAYFNATLLLLSGGALWDLGNPYRDGTGDGIVGRLGMREAGFGVLGGPHVLALVSEVATRALKVVWNQKWQVNLRLRPEAYGGLAHVQAIGIGGPDPTRAYGLPSWVTATAAAQAVQNKHGTLLLPMAFTPGSPTHPAYGAGHATVAGCCVTVLKAFFKTFDPTTNTAVKFGTLTERDEPYGAGSPIKAYVTGVTQDANGNDVGVRTELSAEEADELTIEGELNKLASNVAMGRSIGGVHWRTDNARSLVLGEAIAAQILADVTVDSNAFPSFSFRTFARRADGEPKQVKVEQGRIFVDGHLVNTTPSAL